MNKEKIIASLFFTGPAIIFCVEHNSPKPILLGLMSASFLIAYLVLDELDNIWKDLSSAKKRAGISKTDRYQCMIYMPNNNQSDPLNVEEEYDFLKD